MLPDVERIYQLEVRGFMKIQETREPSLEIKANKSKQISEARELSVVLKLFLSSTFKRPVVPVKLCQTNN